MNQSHGKSETDQKYAKEAYYNGYNPKPNLVVGH